MASRERTCICGPGDATGKTVGAAVEYAVVPSHHGRIAATVPLRGGRPGDVLYEVDWDSPRPRTSGTTGTPSSNCASPPTTTLTGHSRPM
ncbi:hypothetical protein ACFC1R_37955 [Kitasatospora sp. NPDC056138]|uniref:hypothetical protein n=1 Tax=Kitasatospora sp. NPDC056138 TaxID=3345724 RepID=UPI0035DF9B2B